MKQTVWHEIQWNEAKKPKLVFSEELPYWFFFFQLYCTTINDLILRQQIILSAVYFFPDLLTLFLTYYSVSSLLRNLRLRLTIPVEGGIARDTVRAFLGNREMCLVMHLVTVHKRDRVSPEQSLPPWEGSHASPAPSAMHWLKSNLWAEGLAVQSPFCRSLGGKEEEVLHFVIHSLECQHSRGCPASPCLFTDSQKVCFYGESSDSEQSVHVMSQLLSSGGTVL